VQPVLRRWQRDRNSHGQRGARRDRRTALHPIAFTTDGDSPAKPAADEQRALNQVLVTAAVEQSQESSRGHRPARRTLTSRWMADDKFR
jgi:hypothetical protein